MTDADHLPSRPLRIGGWLPPVGVRTPSPLDEVAAHEDPGAHQDASTQEDPGAHEEVTAHRPEVHPPLPRRVRRTHDHRQPPPAAAPPVTELPTPVPAAEPLAPLPDLTSALSGFEWPRPSPETQAPVRPAMPAPGRAYALDLVDRPSLPEQTAFRHALTGPAGLGRARAFLVVAVAAGVPLALGMAGSPTEHDPFIATHLTPPTYGTTAPEGLIPPAATTAPTLPGSTPSGTPTGAPTTGAPAPSATTGQHTGPTSNPGKIASPTPPRQSTAPPKASGQGGAGVSISLEAEGSAADWSGPTRERELADASGGVVVGSTDQGLVGVLLYRGASVVFRGISVPESGEYTVTFYYAAPATRQAVVSANGNGRTTLRFAATGDGGTSIDALSISVRLNAGSNTIEFGNRDAPIPDLDRIVVTR